MSDISQLLTTIQSGDRQCTDQLLPMVYTELRKLAHSKLAREGAAQLLQTTALVHEAYLRLVETNEKPWENAGHFIAAAAEAMRRVLVENARRREALRHGGGFAQASLTPDELAATTSRDPAELLAVHEALDELAERSSRKAELVKLRYFLGCTIAEAAEVLGIAPTTAEGDWTYAKAWLKCRLGRGA
jgi:RNA polymerase sigma factor (TIGR02999 family)